MDRRDIDDQHLVARYLADQLSDAERAGFEDALVSDPQLAHEVELAARLKSGLWTLQRTQQLAPLLASRTWYQQPRMLALAASLVIVALSVVVWLGTRTSLAPILSADLQSLVDVRGAPLTVSATHTVRRSRSLGVDAVIKWAPQPQAVAIRILPEYGAGEQARFDVALEAAEDGDGPPGRPSVQVTSGEDGLLTVYLDASRLQPGPYQLTVRPAGARPDDERTSRFRLVLVP